MNVVVPVLSIAGAIAVGAISPGPSFVFVSRTAIALSSRDGLAAALGMGLGGVCYAALALFGLQAVLAQVEWLYVLLRVAGGLYLVYLGLRLWQGAHAPLSIPADGEARLRSPGRSFGLALLTQLSNPKAAIVYSSVFAAFLPPDMPRWTFAVLLPTIFAVEAGWYAAVALALSSSGPRAVYLRFKAWADRAAGLVLGALGVKLVGEAALPR